MTSLIAQELRLRELAVPHRLFMAPMCQYSAVDGVAGSWHRRHYAERALGGAALVVIEATAVSPEGRISPADLGLWNDAQRDALALLVDDIHAAGAAVAVQLAHAGRKASTAAPWLGGAPVPPDAGGWPVLGPSPIPFGDGYPVPRELGASDIARIVGDFAAAARRACQAGVDALELHAAHGYLVHQFLSPLANRRKDAYGRDAAGRARLFYELAEALRAAMPEAMPLLARVSATDWIEGGWDLRDCEALLADSSSRGLDFIDVSSGGLSPLARVPVGPGYQVGLAAAVRRVAGVPVGAVGLITTMEQAEQALASGSADAVSLGRLLLRDPYWPARNLPEAVRRVPGQYLRAFT